MADVRAEILAASRSRTGWLEQAVEEKSRPFLGSLKTSLEDTPQAKVMSREKMTSPTRMEPARKLGTKVSTIANMFQALSPQKEENEQFKKSHVIKSNSLQVAKNRLIQDNKADEVDNALTQKPQQPQAVVKTSTTLARTESHLTRFNNARAMFENLEQKKQSLKNLSSPKRQPSSSSSSPIHSPLLLESSSSPVPTNESSSLESLNNRSVLSNQNLNQDAISPALSYDSPLELTPDSENGDDFQNPSVHERPSNVNITLQYDTQKNITEMPDCTSSPKVANGRQLPTSAIESRKESVDLLNASLQKNLCSESNTSSTMGLLLEECSDTSQNNEDLKVSSTEELCNTTKFIKPSARNNFSSQNASVNHSKKYSETGDHSEKSPRHSSEFNDNWQENDGMDMDSIQDNYYHEDSCDPSEPHLRDSGGETLAEFECREQELFLVEAVLSTEDAKIIKSNSFMGSSVDDVELMTQEEADHLLSTSSRKSILSDDEAQEVEYLLAQESASVRNSFAQSSAKAKEETNTSHVSSCSNQGAERSVLHEDVEYHVFSDGHYFHEMAGLQDESEEEAVFYCPVPPKRKTKVRFSTGPIKVYSTFSIEDYDRHNDEVDPVSASAEYELEKRIENMDVFPVDIMKGPEGLGLSIIGMGVGADAGLEKLGIFIKTITESGAAHKDGRIHVNDQIIEVDGKSLVGVTQAYAASVLRNTSGLVRFLIGRDKEGANSEIAQLISMSLQADKEHQEHSQKYEGGLPPLPDPPERQDSRSNSSSSQSSSSSHDTTPEEGEAGLDVYDLAHESSRSFSSEGSPEVLRVKVKEWQLKCAVSDAELKQIKAKADVDRAEWQQQLDFLKGRLSETEGTLQEARKDIVTCKQHVEQTEQQCTILQRKYTKAKKVIRQFQQREQEFIQQQEFHVQQAQEKDQEYNAIVMSLKDRIILLEKTLTDLQKQFGMPVTLPHDTTLNVVKPDSKTYQNSAFIFTNSTKRLELEMSDPELSDTEGPKLELSPELEDEGNRRISTLERRYLNGEFFDKAVPQTELLDTSAAKSKAELASKGSLANRQPPTLKKQCSSNSIDEMVLDEAGQSPKSSFSRSPLSQPETPLESPERLETSLCFRNSWVSSGTESFASKYAGDIKQVPDPLPSQEEHPSPPPPPIGETFLQDVPPPNPRQGFPPAHDGVQRVHYPSNGDTKAEGQPPPVQPHAYTHQSISHHTIRANVAACIAAHEKASTLPQVSRRHPRPAVQLPTPGFPVPAEEGKSVRDSRYRDSVNGSDMQSRYSGSHLPPPPPEHQPVQYQQMHQQHQHHQQQQHPAGWQNRPVQDWSAEQVGQWLSAMGLAIHLPRFLESRITGQLLIQLDSARLKALGVVSSTERNMIKKKVKDIRSQLERERKAQEKELKAKEKQLKKHSDKIFKKK